MRFNGKDLLEVHEAVSRAIEVPPGMAARDIATAEGADGEIVVGLTAARDEYVVRVNIAARTYEEAFEARLQLAAWAGSSGRQTARLEPTHAPGKAYDAIVKSIGKLEKRFTTVDVVFLLPKPHLYDITPQIRTASGTELGVLVGGSAAVQPLLKWTPATSAANPRILLDGETIFGLKDTLSAGQELAWDMETGKLTVAGNEAGSRLLFTVTNPDAELAPGRHTLSVSTAGNIEARWHTRWQ